MIVRRRNKVSLKYFKDKYERAEAELVRITETYGRKSDEWYRAAAKRDYYCNKYINNKNRKEKE